MELYCKDKASVDHSKDSFTKPASKPNNSNTKTLELSGSQVFLEQKYIWISGFLIAEVYMDLRFYYKA